MPSSTKEVRTDVCADGYFIFLKSLPEKKWRSQKFNHWIDWSTRLLISFSQYSSRKFRQRYTSSVAILDSQHHLYLQSIAHMHVPWEMCLESRLQCSRFICISIGICIYTYIFYLCTYVCECHVHDIHILCTYICTMGIAEVGIYHINSIHPSILRLFTAHSRCWWWQSKAIVSYMLMNDCRDRTFQGALD